MNDTGLHWIRGGAATLLSGDEFEQRLHTEVSRVNRHGGELGLIAFSLDNLPSVTEQLPQRGGDALLDQLGAHMQRRIRAHDLLGQRGAGEFMVMAPAMEMSEVTGFAVKLRRLVDEYQYDGADPISASFGVAQFRRGESAEELEQRALRAMSRARAAGGNRITAARAGD